MSISKWIADPNRAEARAALAVCDLANATHGELCWFAAGHKDEGGHGDDYVEQCARAGIDEQAARAIYANARPDVNGANAVTFRIAAYARGYRYGPASNACRIEIEKKDPNAPDGFDMYEIEQVMGAPIPEDHAQALAYARILQPRLFAVDEYRYDQALLLGLAPDRIVDLWHEISQQAALRSQQEAAAARETRARHLRIIEPDDGA